MGLWFDSHRDSCVCLDIRDVTGPLRFLDSFVVSIPAIFLIKWSCYILNIASSKKKKAIFFSFHFYFVLHSSSPWILRDSKKKLGGRQNMCFDRFHVFIICFISHSVESLPRIVKVFMNCFVSVNPDVSFSLSLERSFLSLSNADTCHDQKLISLRLLQ